MEPLYSIVLPLKDESANILPLLEEIETTMKAIAPYEILLIDDGSNDDTWEIISSLSRHRPIVRALRLDRNYGQSTALISGFQAARAPFIITLDGDGQNVPADIQRLIEKMTPECALVTGVRLKREDRLLKRWISRCANALRGRLLEDHMRDTGCSLKLFRREVLLTLPRFAGMHRFFPALCLIHGHKVVEVEVNHRPRLSGKSKYSLKNRSLNTIVDLFGVFWLKRRRILYRIEEQAPRN